MLLVIGTSAIIAITAAVSAAAAVAGGAISAATTQSTNKANAESVDESNASNLQIARETNAANAEQANIAYQRSLPVNQVRDMISAGMSKGAALNKLSGGGTYTPAPQISGAPMIPKNFNPLNLSSAFDRLGDIPANIQQQKLVDEQINAIQTDVDVKRNADLRAAEEHESKQSNELYSRKEQRSYDELSNALDAALTEKGLSYDDIKSMNDIRDLIGDTAAWKNRKGNSVTRLFNDVSQNRLQLRNETAALDVHELSRSRLSLEKLDKVLKSKDIKWFDKEKSAQLLKISRESEKVLAEGRLTDANAQQAEFDNIVRAAGIDDESEARALANYAEMLANEEESLYQKERSEYRDKYPKVSEFARHSPLRTIANYIRLGFKKK